MWEPHLLSAEVGEEELLYQMIRDQRGEFGRLHHPFTGQEQLAIGKEVRRGVGLEGVALLNLAAAARTSSGLRFVPMFEGWKRYKGIWKLESIDGRATLYRSGPAARVRFSLL